MKIINLLSKIANGEEVPEKIHIKQFQCDFIFNGYTYLSDEKEPQNIYWCLHSEALNYEVEILEEEREIPEKIKKIKNGDFLELPSTNDIMNKINEIIDYLKSKGE